MTTACDLVESGFSLQDINTGELYFTSGAVNVLGFSLALGIGDDSSTLSLEITGDPVCDGNTVVRAPELGVPLMFKSLTGEFYFGGILNNITYNESASGFKYILKITDPKRLMSSVTVLLKNYYCEIKDCNNKQAKNFINAAYLIEGKDCAVCPPGDDYETFPKMKSCAKFGTSGVRLSGPRNGGVSLKKVFEALQANDTKIYTTNPSDDRNLRFDFSELITKLTQIGEWSTSTAEYESLTGLIDKAAKDCACDYLSTIELNGRIKIWMIDRSVQSPNNNNIESLINIQKQSRRNVTNCSYGVQEVYEPANKIVIGDNINYLRELDIDFQSQAANSDKTVYMFFGYKEPVGNPPVVETIAVTPFEFQTKGVEINISSLSDLFQARGKNIPRTILVTEQEMLYAQKNQNLWMLYGLIPRINNGEPGLAGLICNVLGIQNQFDIQKLINATNAIFDQGPPPGVGPLKTREIYWKEKFKELLILNGPAAKKESFILFEMAWTWFQNFINTYYGKKFFISAGKLCIFPNPAQAAAIVPGAQAFKKSDNGFFELSDVPQDSGYPSKNQLKNGIKGLFHPNDTAFFQTSDGKISGFVIADLEQSRTIRFNQPTQFRVAIEEMNSGSYFSKNLAINNLDRATGKAYIKISVENEIFLKNNKSYVLISLDNIIPMVPDFCVDANGKPIDPDACADQFLTSGIRSMAAIFGKDKFSNRSNKFGYANISEFNSFTLGNATGGFIAAVIPLKSNYYSYGRNKDTCGGIDGPFLGNKGIVGATEIEIKTDLNPWSYGGYDQMEFVGAQLALIGVRGDNIEEDGEMSVAEPPGYSLSYYIRTYGLLLSNINVNYGASGATTTYSFSSKTPRYANYAESLSNQLRKIATARQEVTDFLNGVKRQTVTDINTLFKNIFAEKAKALNPPSTQEKTPVALFLGGYRDIKMDNFEASGIAPSGDSTTTSKISCEEICNPTGVPLEEANDGSETKYRSYDAGIDKVLTGALQIAFTGDEFKSQIMMSIDGMFAPVSIKGRIGSDDKWRAPRYFENWKKDPPNNRLSKISRPRPPMPPLEDKGESLPINQKYLNPILSKGILADWDDRKGKTEKGCHIQFLSYENDPKYIYDEDKKEDATDFGFFSLRGPLVLQSWGYDTEGKPIPNAIDSPQRAEVGDFQNQGLKNKFMTHWMKNPASWPVGPIDLRFDRTRGVWVAPAQSERILVAQLVTTLKPYGTARAVLNNPVVNEEAYFQEYDAWGKNGEKLFNNLKDIKITVYDFLGRSLCGGTRVYLTNVDGKYIVLESSVVDESTCTEDCECTTGTTTTTTTTTETTTETPPTECPDVCGLAACIAAINGNGSAGILGVDENGCLTIYELTECETPSP